MRFLTRFFTDIRMFLAVFLVIAAVSGIYYYGRVVQEDSSDICFSDFRVFWYAAYSMRHYVLLDAADGRPVFRQFWFLRPQIRDRVKPVLKIGEPDSYIIYDKNVEFYHYRYSPFVAFALMPLGKISSKAQALAIWYFILNVAYLLGVFILWRITARDFGISEKLKKYALLWVIFFAGLRFYLLNISLGQTDILLFLFFVLFLASYVTNREILCGALLGLILHFKILFLPVAFYFLLTGRIKIVLSTAISSALLLLMPAYMIGLEKLFGLLSDWKELMAFSVARQAFNAKNQSAVYFMHSLIARWVPSGENTAIGYFYAISALFTLIYCAALAAFRKSMERRRDKAFEYVEISALVSLSILFSLIAWKAYFISLLIPLAVITAFLLKGLRNKIIYLCLAVFFVLSCMIGTDLTKFIPGVNEARLPNIPVGAIILIAGLFYSYSIWRRGSACGKSS